MRIIRVVFALSYDIETDDENDAIDQAENLFVEEIDNRSCGLTKLFGVNTEEIN